jgi:hypothetical protein
MKITEEQLRNLIKQVVKEDVDQSVYRTSALNNAELLEAAALKLVRALKHRNAAEVRSALSTVEFYVSSIKNNVDLLIDEPSEDE